MEILKSATTTSIGRFNVFIDKDIVYKKNKHTSLGDVLIHQLNNPSDFILYENIIKHINILPHIGKHIIKGYDVEQDGSYKSPHIEGYRLDQVLTHNALSKRTINERKLFHFMHKEIQTLEGFNDIISQKIKIQTKILLENINKYSKENILGGDWALHNLIYSVKDDIIYNVDLEGFFSYQTLPDFGNIHKINEWLHNVINTMSIENFRRSYVFKPIEDEKEDLDFINGSRPKEVHTIIAWDGINDYASTKEYLNNFIGINILYEGKLELNNDDELKLSQSIYKKNESRVKNKHIYLIIIEDLNPIYSYEKSTTCMQVLNKNMKFIKEDMRLKIGGSKTAYHSIHTSYNQEEALLVLKPLNLDHFIKRPNFKDFKDFFDFINSNEKLKYLVQRSFYEIEYPLEYFKNGHDIDILVNDYYYFKALTGARSVNSTKMRENDNGYNIQSKINIGGVEVPFDIRYVGDNYVDAVWEKEMIKKRIKHTLKNDITIYIPNESDEVFSLIYHINIQKINPRKSKHLPRVQELLDETLDFDSMQELLTAFMEKKEYKFKRPHDKGVGFYLQ